MPILVNVAKLQHAYHIRNAVFRPLPSASSISRRDLFKAIPRALRIESDIPIVIAGRCKRCEKSCNYCRKACPVNAISEVEDSVTINDRLCIERGGVREGLPDRCHTVLVNF